MRRGLWLADREYEHRVNVAGRAGRDQIIEDLESQGNSFRFSSVSNGELLINWGV